MTTESPKHPLDHATARIVEELAAALLPHLKETVSAELARTIESLPVNIDREVEEALLSLRRLQTISEDMTGALNSAQSFASRLLDELASLSRTSETLNAAATRLEQFAAKPDMNDDAKVRDELLRSLQASLYDWGGILKANGRAQTKELNEFSAEVSEQVGWMKSSLPAMLGETLEKAVSSRTEEGRTIGEVGKSVRTLEVRLARLERIVKIILVEGIVLIAALAAIAAALYLK